MAGLGSESCCASINCTVVPEQLKLVELQDHRFRHILVKDQFRCNQVDKENLQDQKTVARVYCLSRTKYFGEIAVDNLDP